MKDVLIIGSGAGGGPLALALSQAGAEVLVLEKGPHYGREDYSRDEISASRRGFFLPPISEDPHLLESPGGRVQPTQMGWTASCVGGGTVAMGGFLYRLHPDDFRMRSRFGAYEELADWPYSYDELEPYYARAEWEMGISGGAGNPFEGPRSLPYPLPPLEEHPISRWLSASCRRLDLHPFPSPRAILSRPYRGRPACTYCDLCASHGCTTGAKSSTQEALLGRAVASGRCTIRARTMVREITVDARGRASGCIYLDQNGEEHRVAAKIVCVCCSAIESARLLLMSRSALFPDGLANTSGLVGRHLQFHGFSNGRARFHYDRHADKPLRDSHPFLSQSVMDFYFLPEGVSDLAKGGLLRFGFPSFGLIGSALREAEEEGSKVWGLELKQRLRRYHGDFRTLDFEVFHDFLPNSRTYVELDARIKDRWGLPVARIHLDVPGHHRRAGAWLVERGLEVLGEMGADEVIAEEIGVSAGILIEGTCRAGDDPESSVLDRDCRAHGVPNLFVVDGSFMPTSGGAPPTLTILANSFRTADRILALARSGAWS